MKVRLQTHLCIIFFMLIPFCQMQIYQLPPTISLTDESIRLNSIHIINEPDLQLNKIYKREIYQKLPESQESNLTIIRPFLACQQSSPEIDFDFIGLCPLQRPGNWTTSFDQQSGQIVYTQKFELIYDYKELKSQYKNIVDMVFYMSHVFTISSAGVINVYRVDEQILNGINLRTSIHVIDWDEKIKQKKQQIKKSLEKQKASNDTENHDQSSEQQQQNPESNELPQSLKYKHLGKGYFQFMDGEQLLLFSNGEFLIAFDVRTFNTTLLSDQQIYAKISANQSSNAASNNSNENSDQQNSQNTDNVEQKQYTILQNFESVTKIDEFHFAVLDRKKGAIVYEVVKNQPFPNQIYTKYHIQKVDIIGKQQFGNAFQQNEEMNLIDIEYNKQKQTLFILDYEKGVFAFDLGSARLINKSEYDFILNPNMIFKKQCNLMEFSQISQSLYLVCSKIHRISLMKWPLIQEKTFPHPMINIRQIFIQEDKNIFVLAGYQVFKVMYLDRPTSYFQDDMLDKIVFYDNMVITANEYHIVVYNYNVEKPSIVCQTSNQSLLGSHNVILKTTAECQQSYLEQINRTKQQKSKFDPEDICVYTVHKNVYVWEQGQIPTQGLTIFIIVFLVFALLMLFWYFVTIWRSRRARTYLQSLAGQSQAALVSEGAQKSQTFKGDHNANHPDEVGQTHSYINKNTQNNNVEGNLHNI